MSAKDRGLQHSLVDLNTLEKLLEVGQSLIIVRDLKSLLHKIAKTACSVLEADVVVLYEYKEETADISVPPIVTGKVRDKTVLQARGRVRPHKESAVFKILKRTKPFYASKAREDWTRLIETWSNEKEWRKSFLYREGIASSAAVPLILEKKKVGVLFVNYRKPHVFQHQERRVIELFASQAATAIHNAALFEQERQRAVDMAVLRRVSAAISTTLDIRRSLVLIAKGAVQLTRIDSTSVIHLFDDAGEKVIDSYEYPEGFGLASSRFSEKKGLTWEVFCTGQIVEVDNISHSKRISQALAESKTQAVIGIPLKQKDRVIGALFINSFEQHTFTDEEKAILGMLAEQAVVVIQNARRYQSELDSRKQAELLSKVSNAISSKLELKEVAFKILSELGKVIEYRKASIQLIQGDTRTLIAGSGFSEPFITEWLLRPISQDRLIRRVVASKKPLILSEPSQDPDWENLPQTADVKTWVGLPLVYRGESVGLLTLDHDRPGFYTQANQDLLVAFGYQAAIAIQNARLFHDARRRIRDLGIINRVVQIMSTKLDAEDLGQAIVTQIADELECTHCTLFLAEKVEGELWLTPKVTHGVRREKIMERRFRPSAGLAGWVFQNGESLVLKDARSDARFAAARDQQDRPRSMLVVPVKVGDQTIGVISADQDEFGWFSENDRQLVDALARQAGIAIQRSIGLKLLRDIGNQIISAREEDQVLQQIVYGAIQLTNTTLGAIYLISEDSKTIVKDYHYPAEFNLPTPRLDRRQGLTYRIVKGPRIIAIADIERDQRVNRELVKLGVKSLVCVPLQLDQQVIGVLYLSDKERHVFSETECALLSTLASQAAIAIRNAQLFRGVEKHRETLERLLETGQEISHLAAQGPRGALGRIARSVCEEVKADCAVIYPYDPTRKDYFDAANVASYGLWHPLILTDKRRERGMVARIRQSPDGILEIADVSQQDPALNRPLMQREQIQAMVGVALQSGGEDVGVLYVNFRRPHSVSTEQRQSIQRYATKAVQAILEGWQAGRVQLPALLRQIAQNALELLEADIVTLYQYRRGRDEEFVTPPAIAGELHEPSPMGRRIYDDDLPALLVRAGQPYYADDVTKEPLIVNAGKTVGGRNGQPGRPRFIAREGIRSSAGVLLRAEDDIVGIMFINYRAPRSFTEQVRRQIGLFASQAAVAIRSTRAFEQAEALREIDRVIASAALEPGRMLDTILEQALNLVGFSKGWISLLDVKTGVLEMKAARGLDQSEWHHLESGRSISWHVARTGELMNVPDVSQETLYDSLFPDTKSELCVPLKYQERVQETVHERVLGVLNLESARPAAFTPIDEELMTALAAGKAAIALETARLLQQERQRADAMQLLREISGRVSASLDLGDTLKFILEGAIRLTGASSGIVRSLDESRQHIERSVERPETFGHPTPRLDNPNSMTRRTIDGGRPIVISDVSQDSRVNPGVIAQGVKSMISLPLKLGEKVIGVLGLNGNQPYQFDKDQSLLVTLAGQAAIAIENARLYEQQRDTNVQLDRKVKELKVLTRMSREAVTTKPRDQILDLVYNQIRKIMDMSHALFFIAFYDEAQKQIEFGLEIGNQTPPEMIQAGKINEIDRICRGKRAKAHSDLEEEVKQWMPGHGAMHPTWG